MQVQAIYSIIQVLAKQLKKTSTTNYEETVRPIFTKKKNESARFSLMSFEGLPNVQN